VSAFELAAHHKRGYDTTMAQPSEYPVLLRLLPESDGGGYLAVVVDLPGCMADGDTPQEAFDSAQDAIAEWMAIATDMGRPVPDPSPQQARSEALKALLGHTSPLAGADLTLLRSSNTSEAGGKPGDLSPRR
jgi:antitoxin HicB